jgi:hypothetical protein
LARYAIRATLTCPLLPHRPKIEMVLQQLPQQLPAGHLQPLLQHGVGQPVGLRAGQPAHRLIEALTGLGEQRCLIHRHVC